MMKQSPKPTKTYPKFKAAAVQAAPVFLDAQATTEKACHLIEEAAQNGAELIAFPEVFIAGYPYWNWIMSPLEGSHWFKKLFLSSVDIDGPEVRAIRQAAKINQVTVVIGINERSPVSMGTIYNSNLTISPEGVILAKHRKLVPTFAEKLTWGSGDGSSIRISETPIGRLGTLACGENTNTLARFALLAQGEQIHVSNYIAFPFTSNYDMPEAIRIRAGAHSFEGKVFTIVSSSAMSSEIIDLLGDTEERLKLLSGSPNAFSGIFGPNGQLLSEPLLDDEGIVYADIDISDSILPKQYQDIIGHYNRFDIFELKVHGRKLDPVSINDSEKVDEPLNDSPSEQSKPSID